MTVFADFSVEGWVVVIAATFLGLEHLFGMWIESNRSREIAEKVERVRTVAQETRVAQKEHASRQDAKLDTIHTLVNSAMGAQKRLLAITARAKADITNAKTDVEEAEHAEREYREHQVKQERVDSQTETRDRHKRQQ